MRWTSEDLYPPREALRYLHPREMIFAGFGITNLHCQRKRKIRDVRKWMSGIDRERCQYGKDLRFEVLVEGAPFLRREIGDADETNTISAELLHQVLEASS